MERNKLWLHQIVLFAVLGVLVLASVVTGKFVFNVDLLWWLLGAVIGFIFVFGDRVVYGFVSRTDETPSVKLKELFQKKKIGGEISLLLAEEYDQKELIMRSFLFVIVWIVLGLFTVTSVANGFARGFVLGIGTHLMFDFVYDFIKDKEKFDTWFWQVKRTFEPEEKRWIVIIFIASYVLLAFGM